MLFGRERKMDNFWWDLSIFSSGLLKINLYELERNGRENTCCKHNYKIAQKCLKLLTYPQARMEPVLRCTTPRVQPT